MLAALLGALMALAPITPARADVIITNSRGGNIDAFAAYFWTLKEFGARVRIDGYCASSCTMVLDLPNVCVTKRALLGFHSAYIDSFNGRVTFAAGTAQLWSHYPAGVRAWLTARGGLTPKLKYMKGADLDAAGLKRCP